MAVMMTQWMQEAADRYDRCIRDTLEWLLARAPLSSGLLNTKVNPLLGTDYDQHSGLRGPDYTYGWIQGRGLEALVTFSDHYCAIDPTLSARLLDRAEALYQTLLNLYDRDEHAYFMYDKHMRPIRQTPDGIEPQSPAGTIYCYSDAFVVKGLLAASLQLDPARTDSHRVSLMKIIEAIESNRFQMGETQQICMAHTLSEPADYGPRMILLGAAGVLHRASHAHNTGFADRFINTVLDHHFDQTSGLLLNIPDEDTCNVGHAIEFCGFAFEHLSKHPKDPRISILTSILIRSVEVGLQGPGIPLSVSAATGRPVSPYYPWWPLPEAIRACALGMLLTPDSDLESLWMKTDTAFFSNYWQADKRIAYQTRTIEGPVDYVPATPDLDPGYHTGLSLLAACKAIEFMRMR